MVIPDLSGDSVKVCVLAAPSILSALVEHDDDWNVHDIPLDTATMLIVRG
jgi:hypothetical protein